MIVLDTHAWIWWNAESDRLSSKALNCIRNSDALGVCIISCWEVAMLVAKQRLSFRMDVQNWIDSALDKPKMHLLPITPKISVLSSRLPGMLTGDPADRIIAATCLENGYPLVSCDKGITEWGQIQVVW